MNSSGTSNPLYFAEIFEVLLASLSNRATISILAAFLAFKYSKR